MTAMHRLLATLLCALTLFLTWGAMSATAQDATLRNQVPEPIANLADQIAQDLEGHGFQVSRGYFKLFTTDDCDSAYRVMGTCYGNNPAAPYILPVVPYWPDEFIDTAIEGAWGETEPGYNAAFRFDEREALIVLGVLPPQAAYFGMQTYVGTRQGMWDTLSYTYTMIATYNPTYLDMFFTYVPANHQRIQLAASLGNSVNNVVVERQSGAAFDQTRFFTITPDQFMDRAVRASLARNAITPTLVFSEPVPSTVKIGLLAEHDDFLTLIRYAMPADGGGPGTPSAQWRADLPMVVLRVRDTNRARPVESYPASILETRTAAANPIETDLQPNLRNLIFAVSQKWNQACDPVDCVTARRASLFQNWQVPLIGLVGPDCVKIGMNCLGDTQDTIYQVSNRLALDNGEVYAVAGPLATQTGNATYVGLGLNSSLKKKGFDNVSSDQLLDTAAAFSTTVTNTAQLYLYYFTRDCTGLDALTGGHCVSIPVETLPACTDPAAGTCDQLTFSLRDYIRPATQRGPDAAKTLPPMVLTLHRPGYGGSQARAYLPAVSRNAVTQQE